MSKLMRGAMHDTSIRTQAARLAQDLAQHAEAVCRQYLSNGRRTGRYWRVGDVANTPGQSLYVRLYGEGAGKWSDAATGEHGDLLDLIALNLKLSTLGSTLEEARRFLGLPHPSLDHRTQFRARNSLELAQRMFASARPIAGTIGEGLSAASRYRDGSGPLRVALSPDMLLSRTRGSPARRNDRHCWRP